MIWTSLGVASQQEAAGLHGATSACLEHKNPVRSTLSSAGAFPALGGAGSLGLPGLGEALTEG